MLVIYKTTNKVNGKVYIGMLTRNDPSYLGSGKLIVRAVKKYGRERFERQILEVCPSKEVLVEREKYWIEYYNSQRRDVGYNITSGGEFGDTFSNNPDKERIRDNFRKAAKKRIEVYGNNFKGKRHTEETKRLIGGKNKEHAIKRMALLTKEERKIKYGSPGIKNSMYGKKHSAEAKLKVSRANSGNKIPREVRFCDCGCGQSKKVPINSPWKYKLGHNSKDNPIFKGKHHTKETRLKISLANKGKVFSEEHKRKLSLSSAGKKRGPMSEEHKKKIAQKLKGRIFTEEWRRRMSIAAKNRVRRKHEAE